MGGRRKYSFFFLALALVEPIIEKNFKKSNVCVQARRTLKNVIAQVRKGEMLAATKVKMCGSEKNK